MIQRVWWVVVVVGLLVPGAGRAAAQPDGTTLGAYSIFAQPIDPQTATYTPQATVGSFRPGTVEFSANIYYFDTVRPGDFPLVTVTNGFRTEVWPVPPYAEGASGGDGHLAVVIRDHGIAYEIIGATWNPSRTVLSGITFLAHPLAGSGRSDGSNGNITASGFAVTAGMVTQDDFRNPATGQLDPNRPIGHALGMSLPRSVLAANRYVLPATCGDSSGQGGVNGIPMGQHYALPPTLNVDALNVHPFTREVLRALRDYGAFIHDSSGIPLENGKAVGGFRVEPGLLEVLYADVDDADTFRLTVGQQVTAVVADVGLYVLNADAPRRVRPNVGSCRNPDVRGDVNADGVVSPADLAFVANRVGAPMYGLARAADVDYNARVDAADLEDVLAVIGTVVGG